jgi:hypothetical protein
MGFGIVPAIFAVGGITAIQLFAFPHERAEASLCDQAVDALLHSKDLVEVQRAGIIIREVNCAIGRRLNDR